MSGTMALCKGPRASKGPRAPAADCCKRRNHAPCMIFHCFLEQMTVIWSVDCRFSGKSLKLLPPDVRF